MTVLTEHGLVLVLPDERHRSYVMATWTQNAWGLVRDLHVPQHLVCAGVREVAKDHMSAARVRVLVDPNDRATAHGWVAGIPGALFGVYVPHALRHRGIGRALVDAATKAET